jgi:phage tail sheath gpL-like
MAISFANIPANIRVPMFYAEISNRQAGFLQENQKALLIGPMLATGTAAANIPVLIVSPSQAYTLFGVGSVLADMVNTYRMNDSFGELWCIPLAPAVGAVAATGVVTITNNASGAGNLNLYVGGMKIVAAVAVGNTPAVAASALAAAINAQPFCLVSAVAAAGAVDLTAKQPGLIGDAIGLQFNYAGLAAGEMFPAGMTGAITTPMTGGTGQALLDTAILNMGDEEYDFIGLAYNDNTVLDEFQTLMNDITGRWAWSRQIYGHAFTAKQDPDGSGLVTFGRTRNDPHMTMLGFGPSPSPYWQRAAALTAQAAASIRIDPARPLQTLPLIGVLPPPPQSRFTLSMNNSLLYSGIATEDQSSGMVRISRCITTYQKNEWGQSDPSYLDYNTLATLTRIVRELRDRITQKFPRSKLADDGTSYGPGQAVVTPSVIRAELIAAYSEMMEVGLVENIQAFKAYLIVERDVNDPNRINVLFPPDLINQLRIFAALVEFRLQYPALAA